VTFTQPMGEPTNQQAADPLSTQKFHRKALFLLNLRVIKYQKCSWIAHLKWLTKDSSNALE